MVSLSDLCEGRLYFYEYEGSIAIAEYCVEIRDDPEYLSGEYVDRDLADIWSEDYKRSGLDLDFRRDTEITILKDVGNAYQDYTIEAIIKDMKEEFPEYFI